MPEITGEARGQLPPGTLVKHPGTGLLLRVERSYLGHGGWAEVDAVRASGMHAGQRWDRTRIDYTDRTEPYVITTD